MVPFRSITGLARGDRRQFDCYFAVFPWSCLPDGAEGLRCGLRERKLGASSQRVGLVKDYRRQPGRPGVARRSGRGRQRSLGMRASRTSSLDDALQDFGYSLSILRHVPDTSPGSTCIRKLKPGAPFLVSVYYRFDNRPLWFQMVWRVSDAIRRVVSKDRRECVTPARRYWHWRSTGLSRAPLCWSSASADRRRRSLSLITATSRIRIRCARWLDRSGTRMEQRFTKREIEGMLLAAGLTDIRFHECEPFWSPSAGARPETNGFMRRGFAGAMGIDRWIGEFDAYAKGR